MPMYRLVHFVIVGSFDDIHINPEHVVSAWANSGVPGEYTDIQLMGRPLPIAVVGTVETVVNRLMGFTLDGEPLFCSICGTAVTEANSAVDPTHTHRLCLNCDSGDAPEPKEGGF